jgi:hypothetical protein
MHSGLWGRYFLPMFRGITKPARPQPLAAVHIVSGCQVPYTPAEMVKRTQTYEAKKAVWDKTMKVQYKQSTITLQTYN